jgi:hypothetical protein
VKTRTIWVSPLNEKQVERKTTTKKNGDITSVKENFSGFRCEEPVLNLNNG